MAPLTDQPIAVIGLGLMGKPIAQNLIGAGAGLTVYNRSPEPVTELTAAGAKSVSSPAQITAPTIILCLWDGAAIRSTITPLLENLAPGTLLIDMGTTDLDTTRWLQKSCQNQHASFLDAPVSGGQQGARDATLSVMVGGESEHFDRALPVFQQLGKKITHTGATGSGQITKLANQIIVAQTVAAVAEALHFARSAGVDPATVRNALTGGFADSKILDLHGQRMIDANYSPGGRTSGQLKDIQLAKNLADQLDITLPGLETNTTLWQKMVGTGHADDDHSAIYHYLQEVSTPRQNPPLPPVS